MGKESTKEILEQKPTLVYKSHSDTMEANGYYDRKLL